MGIGGFSHWIIILIIVLVLFGAGRVSNIMGELGKGIKSFKEGMSEDEDEKLRRYSEQRREEERRAEEQRRLGRPGEPIDVTPEPRRTETVVPPPPPPPPPPPADDRNR